MDPISMIVMALVTGAAAALKPTAEAVIKDAYAGLKRIIQDRYKGVSVDLIESDPASKSRQAVVKEDLEKTDVAQNEEVLRKAKDLLDAIQSRDANAPMTVGIDLENFKAATITAKKVTAEGARATGIRIKGGEITGDANFEDVQAKSGGGGDHPKP